MLLLDRGLGCGLAEALRARGVEAAGFRERFDPDAPDDAWLAEAAERGWLLISDDRRLLLPSAPRHVLMSHRVGCVVLLAPALGREAQAAALATAADAVARLLERTPRPFVLGLRADGTVEPPRFPRRGARRVTAPRAERRAAEASAGYADQPPLPGLAED